jgi:hypothetical protein
MRERFLVALLLISCSKKADEPKKELPKPGPKTPERTPDTPTVDRSPAPAGSPFVGFFRIESITVDGKTQKLEEAFRASLKGDGQELDFMRMTLEFEADKLNVGNDLVFGTPGNATYCSVHAQSELVIKDGKFTMGTLEAKADSGTVEVKGGETNRDSAKCNVSLKRGDYTIKDSGKTVELHVENDNKQVVLHLVAEEKEVDLKARAEAFAKK